VKTTRAYELLPERGRAGRLIVSLGGDGGGERRRRLRTPSSSTPSRPSTIVALPSTLGGDGGGELGLGTAPPSSRGPRPRISSMSGEVLPMG